MRSGIVSLIAISAGVGTSAADPWAAVDPAPPLPNPPLVGFSFSAAALPPGTNPEQALARLLSSLQPDIVRLPVYWGTVAVSPDQLDYAELDRLIGVVSAHNAQTPSRPTQIALVVGARNLVFPEIHLPAWLEVAGTHKLEPLLATPRYHRYLETTFRRYATLPLLRAWQVENEPLDNASLGPVTYGALSEALIRSEIELLRSIDLVHQAVVTTFNSSHVALDIQAGSYMNWLYNLLPGGKPVGHPWQALTMGDVLGLDLYVVTAATPLKVISSSTRIAWKEESLDFWQAQATRHGRGLWITEMQGSPWIGTSGFTTTNLLSSAIAYRGHGVGVYLLWGVEDWLTSPEWMKAGTTAIGLLRGGP